MEIIIFLFSGIFIGVIAGLFGLGGGLLIVPVLTYSLIFFSKIPLEQAILIAISTALASMVMTGAVAVYAHKNNNNISLTIIKRFLVGLILGSLIVGFSIDLIPGDYLRAGFIIYVFFTAYRMFVDRRTTNRPSLPSFMKANIIGFFFALISGVLGIGGGTLFTPYLIKRDVPSKLAIGTSSAFGFFIGLFTSITVFINSTAFELNSLPLIGYVYVPAILFLTLPSLLFVKISAGWLIKLSDDCAKKWFASLLIIIGVLMIFQS